MNQICISFTNETPGINLELVSMAGVGLPLPDNSSFNRPVVNNLTAIWDTGATGCAITEKVASQVKAPIINQVLVGGVHGAQMCNQYLISLFLPNGVFLPEVTVTELSADAGCDLLIGMDIISLGDFSTSTIGGRTSFSFRIPSCQKQDYAKFWPKDTSICTCGSGNMFKNCCKRMIPKGVLR